MDSVDRTFRAISFFTGLSFGMVLPILFVFLKDKGISNGELAILALTATITTTLLDLPSGNIADKFGRKITFLVGQVPFLLFCIGITISETFTGLAASMFLSGLSTALVSGTLDSIYVQKHNQSGGVSSLQAKLAKLSFYSLYGTLVGAATGIALGMLVEHTDNSFFKVLQDNIFILVGCAAIVLSLFVARFVKEPAIEGTVISQEKGLEGFKRTFHQSIDIFFRSKELLIINTSGAIAAAAYICFEKFWQIHVDNMTGQPISRAVFYLFFCGGLAISIAGQQISIKLCEFFKNNLVYPILATRLVLILAFVLLSFSFDMKTFALCYALIYLASSSSASPLMALFHRFATDDLRTSLLSIRSVAIQLGATLGIIQAGLVSQYFSINAAFLSSAALYVVSTIVFASGMKRLQTSPGTTSAHEHV